MLAMQQVANSYSLPAPVGGLNARDSVAAMPETDATALDNWFPNTTSVDLRRGYEVALSVNGTIETIFVYNALGTEIFVAINSVIDSIVSASAAIATTGHFPSLHKPSLHAPSLHVPQGETSGEVVGGESELVQVITNARWDYVNIGNTAGQFLIAVNGFDTPMKYDGTAWATTAITGSGLTPEELSSVVEYAERLWFIEKDTFNVWYLPVNAIAGTAIKLNVGSLFSFGGTLSNIVTWSADTASLLADFIAFVSTQGEVVVFTGDDPAAVATWQRVGQFRIGKPVTKGMRCWTKVGSDAVMITADGIIPLSLAVQQGRFNVSAALTDKIRTSFNRDVAAHGARFGWDIAIHAAGQKLIVNVPSSANSSYQYVMNTQTGAWCRFTDWNAYCLATDKDNLYWGGADVLAEADTGLDDAGDSINAIGRQASTYFGQRGRQKFMTMARPILILDGPITLRIGVDVDYKVTDAYSVIPIDGDAGDPWDTDWDAVWSGQSFVYNQWNSVRGIGFAIAPKIRVQASGVNLSWAATDAVYEFGSIL